MQLVPKANEISSHIILTHRLTSLCSSHTTSLEKQLCEPRLTAPQDSFLALSYKGGGGGDKKKSGKQWLNARENWTVGTPVKGIAIKDIPAISCSL